MDARAHARASSVAITEREPVGQLVLRGDVHEPAFATKAAGVLGFDLPVEANTVTGNKGRYAIWMGPREWLIVVPRGRADSERAELEQALSDCHVAVADVSDARVVLRLSGPEARNLLVKGCAVDLHPREFGPGHCVQTRLARCQMLLHQLDDTPSYDIYVHRSFARYAWAWLCDAGLEFGIRAPAA